MVTPGYKVLLRSDSKTTRLCRLTVSRRLLPACLPVNARRDSTRYDGRPARGECDRCASPSRVLGSSLRDSLGSGGHCRGSLASHAEDRPPVYSSCATRPRGLSHVAAWIGSSPNARIVRHAMNRGPPWSAACRLGPQFDSGYTDGFLCDHLAPVVSSSRAARCTQPSGCLLPMYTAAPSPYSWHALDRLCRAMRAVWQYSPFDPG